MAHIDGELDGYMLCMPTTDDIYIFWVDKDEIRPWYSNYYVHYNSSTDLSNQVCIYPTFTASNLSIDSTLHRSGYMWISWNHLCYTDNTWDEIWQYWYGDINIK